MITVNPEGAWELQLTKVSMDGDQGEWIGLQQEKVDGMRKPDSQGD